jgi:hypothetical protein
MQAPRGFVVWAVTPTPAPSSHGSGLNIIGASASPSAESPSGLTPTAFAGATSGLRRRTSTPAVGGTSRQSASSASQSPRRHHPRVPDWVSTSMVSTGHVGRESGRRRPTDPSSSAIREGRTTSPPCRLTCQATPADRRAASRPTVSNSCAVPACPATCTLSATAGLATSTNPCVLAGVPVAS